mmetsp:Transcript_21000/g.39410  ORF Transcript_21000/g.39410 Transcript_21000/m.39410 type:complete len:87 (-) Transcript_21000:185-445(-)
MLLQPKPRKLLKEERTRRCGRNAKPMRAKYITGTQKPMRHLGTNPPASSKSKPETFFRAKIVAARGRFVCVVCVHSNVRNDEASSG